MTEWTPPTSALRPYLAIGTAMRMRVRSAARERGLNPLEAEKMLAALGVTRWADQMITLDDWAHLQSHL